MILAGCAQDAGHPSRTVKLVLPDRRHVYPCTSHSRFSHNWPGISNATCCLVFDYRFCGDSIRSELEPLITSVFRRVEWILDLFAAIKG